MRRQTGRFDIHGSAGCGSVGLSIHVHGEITYTPLTSLHVRFYANIGGWHPTLFEFSI